MYLRNVDRERLHNESKDTFTTVALFCDIQNVISKSTDLKRFTFISFSVYVVIFPTNHLRIVREFGYLWKTFRL